MIQIYVDALCDLSPNFPSVKTLPYLFSINGESVSSSALTNENIYNLLKEKNYPKTSRPNLGVWVELIEDDLKKGLDILYIGSTSKMTGALSSINIIRSLLKDKYPDNNIYILETPYISGAINLIIDEVTTNNKTLDNIQMYYIVKDTFTLFNNNRMNDNIDKVSVISMKDGITIVDKIFDSYIEALDYIKTKILGRNKSIDLCYSYDMAESSRLKDLENFCSQCTTNLDSHEILPCMYTYVGLNTLGVSIVRESV